MKSAAEWFEEGLAAIALSHSADTQSELRGDLESVVAAFEQVLALDPSYPGAQHQRGLALAHLGQHEAAVDAFVAAVALAPADADLRLAGAQSLATLGQSEAALAAFEEVLRLRPGDEEALFGRAAALLLLGRDELALAAWDEVLASPDNRTLHFHGRNLRVLMGDFRRLRALLSRATALAHLDRPEAFQAFGAVFDAAAADPSTPVDLHGALRDLEVARAAYRAHVEARADEVSTWRRAGGLWSAAGRMAEAHQAWAEAVQRAPTDAHVWFGKAEAHARAEQFDEAIAAYRQALVLRPGFLGASARLEVVLRLTAASRSPGG